uniref:Armadillo type fold n=1 Tax=Echinococcus granulosus TaxID=6210 RepID=A0A068WZD7_ECHGR|nr:Armadillo type fold [Echinococcus granulosus]
MHPISGVAASGAGAAATAAAQIGVHSVNGSVSVVSSFFFSPMDLAPILIAASSSDPQAVQLASTQLESMSTSDPLFLSQLANVVLSPTVSLPAAAKIFGLVHLKNLISNSTQWCNFDRAQQEFLITCLLQYLRQNSSPSPFVSEIFGRVFRHEWSKGTWPEELWNAIIELGAWTPLRRCVQRAAALRLTPRRRILASHICTLLPRLVGLWIESNSPELLHTIYTCITVLDASAAADMMSTHAAVVGGLITRAMARLLSSECKNPKRLAKLLHAVLFLIPSELRSSCAVSTLETIVSVVEDASLDRNTILWCLSLIFNLISATFRDSVPNDRLAKFPSIMAEARSQVLSWLSSASIKVPQYNNAVCLLLSLMRSWMPLLLSEIEALSTDPESSYSRGGAHCVDDEGDGSAFFAESFWNLEPVSAIADFIPVNAEVPPNLRQLAESTFRLLAKHLSEHLEAILPPAIEELMAGEAKMKEVGLRCAQFLLEITPGQWCERVDALLTMTATSLVEPLVTGRRMSLMVHRALIGSNSSEVIRQNCIATLLQLIQYLSAQCSPKSFRIAIHLAAAYCLSWLLENPHFPPDSLSKAPASTLQQILNCLVNLAQEVEEVETQLLVLRYLQSIFENADVETQFGCFINAVQQLWKIGEGTMALRASLVDLVATVMRALNADVTSAAVAWAAEQLACLTVSSVLVPDLMRFIRLGCDGGGDSGNAGDVEVLGDACLRLWHSLVTGSGAVWLPPLESLMPLLIDSQCSGGNGCETENSEQTLYARLETADQAQLFFGIATGCLRLAASSAFLSTWTEAFWRPLLRETITANAMRADIVAAKFANSVIDVPVEEKFDLLLEQLQLLTAWSSQLIRFHVAFSPSVCYLLILHTRISLLQSPVEAHNDSAFKSNQLRLLLLAQLAASPEHWNFLLALLTTVETSVSTPHDFAQDCLHLSTGYSSLVNGDTSGCQRCLDALLTRILDRADALSSRLHRRCFALASVYCLRHLTPSDRLYDEYLEPVISLCVQVLYELDDCPVTAVDATAWVAPPTVAPPEQLKASLRYLLGDTSAITTSHVDPALLSQFNKKLV